MAQAGLWAGVRRISSVVKNNNHATSGGGAVAAAFVAFFTSEAVREKGDWKVIGSHFRDDWEVIGGDWG